MFRDGPLTRKSRETIRFGTGRCALGALAVASSERGIVSIMVRDTQARLMRDLDARFPKARLVRDERASKATVAKVARYIAAPFKPFAAPLDIRGTELQRRIWDEVRKIPFGETSTYSTIAEAVGAPKAIRAVAQPAHGAGSPSPSRATACCTSRRTGATAANIAGSITRRSSSRVGLGERDRARLQQRLEVRDHLRPAAGDGGNEL